MEKQKQRISVPKMKETSERRAHGRLNSLQIPKDAPEDLPDDENSGVGALAVYSRSEIAHRCRA